MTKQEFKKWFDANFWSWTYDADRPMTSFLYSLEEFAVKEYNLARRKERGAETRTNFEKNETVGKSNQTG